MLCIVQEATFALHGHSYFALTLIVPIAVERMSECLSILVADWALLQKIVTHPVREAQGLLIICTFKARDTFRCYIRTVHSINTFRFVVAFGGAGDARNTARSWSTSGGAVKSWNTARSWGTSSGAVKPRNTTRGWGTGFGGTFGWAIYSWSTLPRSCSSGTIDTRDAF